MAALPNPDDSLLAEVRCGNRAALATVYDRYSPAIYRYLVRRVGDPRVAEDLTGIVFLKLLEAVQKRRAWTTTFVGWLYRIAHNAVIDYFRSAGRRSETELDDAVESHLDAPEWLAERAATRNEIRAALNTLTDDQCQVVVLRFGEGFNTREVGLIMGKSEGAVKLLQHRAMHALRRHLVAEEL